MAGLGYQYGGIKVNKYLYQGKELMEDHSLNLYDFHARGYDPVIGRWSVVDPLAHEREWLSPFNYVQNNPMLRVDPTGAIDEPVYGSDGTYRGDTKEGFTGKVLIYDGDIDFSNMSKDELLSTDGANTYDNLRGSLAGDSKAKIWTHIASKMEGTKIFDETFSLSALSDGKISFSATDPGSWNSRIKSKTITGTDKYSYQTTVENLQSTIVVHEWYSHVQKKVGTYAGNHRLAYENIINFRSLWGNTTDTYKGFNVRMLQKYTKDETGNGVEGSFLDVYNKYKGK